jgi:hypothetical protein
MARNPGIELKDGKVCVVSNEAKENTRLRIQLKEEMSG